ncbi:relaxase/mobilization nuclease domain-containing protein [Nesterenkonia alba]|uniref:relaxase/mobilization nuclease domain-containing protein n=1 Tax=Nesterenkonia alba TaxID=515814 RepID=UPI0003B486B7|nr:relaxase/mobilization nuclease domain-containing protein [Nesterenkonia alba]
MTAITNVKPVYELGERSDYLTVGVGEKKHQHRAAGTDRVAYFYCDEPDVEAFIARGNKLAAQHGRRVKAHSYVVSFSPDVLDVNRPEDVQRGGDLAFLLAKKMRPRSSALVIGHVDGSCVHAHVVTLNHDEQTGAAPKDYRMHWQVRQANDELLREQGMEALQPQHTSSQAGYWAQRRGELDGFDQMLGDAVAGALADPDAVDMVSFRAACADRGVQVEEKRHPVKKDGYRGLRAGDQAVGLVYKMRDTTGSGDGRKPRLRRRAAGKLSPEFTTDGLTEAFTAKTKSTQNSQPTTKPDAAEPDVQVEEDFDLIAARFRRSLAARQPKSPARQRHLDAKLGQPTQQRDRTYGD